MTLSPMYFVLLILENGVDTFFASGLQGTNTHHYHLSGPLFQDTPLSIRAIREME